jgi:hypothetical protein
VPGAAFVVLSFVIGMARAAAIVLGAVLPAIRVTIRVAILAAVFAAILPAIFTARGFIGLASDGRCRKKGARDEQCSTQLCKSSHCKLLKVNAQGPAGRCFNNNDRLPRLFRG